MLINIKKKEAKAIFTSINFLVEESEKELDQYESYLPEEVYNGLALAAQLIKLLRDKFDETAVEVNHNELIHRITNVIWHKGHEIDKMSHNDIDKLIKQTIEDYETI